MAMRGHCRYSDDGYHNPTILGDPWSEMTYYYCLTCQEKQERSMGTFYGEKKPVPLTLAERITKLEKELDELKGGQWTQNKL